MILRLSFILGNLMAKSDLSRTRFFQQPKSLDVLLTVFKYYLDLDQKVKAYFSHSVQLYPVLLGS